MYIYKYFYARVHSHTQAACRLGGDESLRNIAKIRFVPIYVRMLAP